MSIDHKFVELAADVLRIILEYYYATQHTRPRAYCSVQQAVVVHKNKIKRKYDCTTDYSRTPLCVVSTSKRYFCSKSHQSVPILNLAEKQNMWLQTLCVLSSYFYLTTSVHTQRLC